MSAQKIPVVILKEGMILRIDDVVAAKGMKEGKPPMPPGGPGSEEF